VQKKPDTKSDWTVKTETGFQKRKKQKNLLGYGGSDTEREKERTAENS
jgi:hypothetical protein